eukprot:2107436-Ditylum_brightwellii.AAC.1
MDSIESYLDTYQIRWARHVAHMPWDHLPHKMLKSWYYSKRPRGASQMTYGQSLYKVLICDEIDKDTLMEEAQNRKERCDRISKF